MVAPPRGRERTRETRGSAEERKVRETARGVVRRATRADESTPERRCWPGSHARARARRSGGPDPAVLTPPFFPLGSSSLCLVSRGSYPVGRASMHSSRSASPSSATTSPSPSDADRNNREKPRRAAVRTAGAAVRTLVRHSAWHVGVSCAGSSGSKVAGYYCRVAAASLRTRRCADRGAPMVDRPAHRRENTPTTAQETKLFAVLTGLFVGGASDFARSR